MRGKCQPVLIPFLHLHGLQTQINHTTISKKILYFSKGEVCPFFRTHLIFFQIPQYLVVKIQTSTYLVRIREPIIHQVFSLHLFQLPLYYLGKSMLMSYLNHLSKVQFLRYYSLHLQPD